MLQRTARLKRESKARNDTRNCENERGSNEQTRRSVKLQRVIESVEVNNKGKTRREVNSTNVAVVNHKAMPQRKRMGNTSVNNKEETRCCACTYHVYRL